MENVLVLCVLEVEGVFDQLVFSFWSKLLQTVKRLAFRLVSKKSL